MEQAGARPVENGHKIIADRLDAKSGQIAQAGLVVFDVLNLIPGLDEISDINNLFLYGHLMGGEIGLRILTVNHRIRVATL